MAVADIAVEDYFNIPNALFRFLEPPSVPATCSFEIDWSGPVTDRSPVSAPPGSSGQLVTCQATMQWSARNDLGFSFTTDHGPTTSFFAQLGKVTNGRFGPH